MKDIYKAVDETVLVLNLLSGEYELFVTLHPTHSDLPLAEQAEALAKILNRSTR